MAEKSLKDLSNSVLRIAENSPKIQKDVEEIRKAICGTDGLVDILLSLETTVKSIAKAKGKPLSLGTGFRNKSLEKTGKSLVKSTDKISVTLNKILDKLQKTKFGNYSLDTNKINLGRQGTSRLSGIESAINIVSKLREIKLKDFILAKTKLKHITNLIASSVKSLKKFKNKEEMNDTLEFINNSIDIIKKLSKISPISKPAQWGANAIQKIYFGKNNKGGLLELFKDMRKNKRDIKEGKQSSLRILAACGSLLLSATVLSALALISPLAIVGAWATTKITKYLMKSFSSMDKKTTKNAKKGALETLAVCGSLLLVSISLSAIAVLSPVAIVGAVMTSAILVVLTGAYKLLSKATTSLIKGSLALVAVSASLIAFAFGFKQLRKSMDKLTLKETGIMVAGLAGTALAVAGIGLAAVPIAIGSGVLLLMGASLGLFGLALKAWRNFDTKPIMENIKTAVGGLRDIFGLSLGKSSDGEKKKPFLSRIGGGILDFATSLLEFGQTFYVMGSILLASAALGVLKLGLKGWENFNAEKAINNIKMTIETLSDVLGLNLNKKNTDLKGKFLNFTGNILGFANSLVQMGNTFAKIGSIVMATASMDAVRLALKPWERYNGLKAINNIELAFNRLSDVFGLNDQSKNVKGIKILSNVAKNLVNMANSLMKMGSSFVKLSHLTLAMVSMNTIRLALKPWNDTKHIRTTENIQKVINNLGDALGDKSPFKRTSVKEFKQNAKDFKKGMEILEKGLSKTDKMKKDSDNLTSLTKSIGSAINTVNAIDLSKATAAKDLFNSMVSLSKVKNNKQLDRFTEAVERFVKACQNMVDSLNKLKGTDSGATASTETNQTVQSTTSATTAVATSSTVSGGVSITNVKQLAEAVADALNHLDIRLDSSMIDVNLVAEGVAGRTVKITVQD